MRTGPNTISLSGKSNCFLTNIMCAAHNDEPKEKQCRERCKSVINIPFSIPNHTHLVLAAQNRMISSLESLIHVRVTMPDVCYQCLNPGINEHHNLKCSNTRRMNVAFRKKG